MIIRGASLIAYLFMVGCVFRKWRLLTKKYDCSSTTSLGVSLVGAVLWPVVVPIAYLELLEAAITETEADIL